MKEQQWLASKDPAAMLKFAHQREGDWRGGRTVSDRKLRLACCADFRRRSLHNNNSRQLELIGKVEEWADGGPPIPQNQWPETHYYILEPIATRAALGQFTGPELSKVRVWQADLIRDIVGNPFQSVTVVGEVPAGYLGNTIWVSRAWLTSLVLSLASDAYEVRPEQKCEHCYAGFVSNLDGGSDRCECCLGVGRVDEGRLDPQRLGILADALIDAGCPEEVECRACDGKGWLPGDMGCRACGATYPGSVGSGRLPHPLLEHLRSPGPHYRGCWAVDLCLNKE